MTPTESTSPVISSPGEAASISTEFNTNLGAAIGLFYGLLDMVLGTGALFVSGILVSRSVGMKSFGAWSTAILFLNLLAVLSSLRGELTMAQLIGQMRGSDTHSDWREPILPALILVSLISLVVPIVFAAARFFVGGTSDQAQLITVLAIMSIALVPISMSLVLTGALRGLEQMREATIAHSLPYLLWVGVAVALAAAKASLMAFVWSYPITFGLVVCYLLLRYRRLILMAYGPESGSASIYRRAHFLVTLGIPLGLAMVVSRGRSQLSSYMVVVRLGTVRAAAYNAGYSIASILVLGLFSIMGIFVPMVARLMAANNLSMASRVYQRITRWLFLPTLIMVVPAMVYAPAVLSVYGHGYASSATAFRILLVAFVLNAVGGPNQAFLIAVGKSRYILYANLANVVISLAANLVLIPIWGINGAALSAALAIVLDNVFASGYLWFRLHIQPFTRCYISLVGFGIISAVLSAWLVPPLIGETLLQGIGFGLLYGAIVAGWVWKSNFADMEDRALVRLLLRRIRGQHL